MNQGSKTSGKRSQILCTATELFTRFGFKRVTVKEICTKASVSKMTFYKYFPDKMELFKEIWNGWIDEAYKKISEIDAKDIPFPEKIKRVIDYKMELLSRMDPEFLEEIFHMSPEMTEFVQHVRSRRHQLFMDFVRQAQERGDIRKIRPEFFLAALDKLYELADEEKLIKVYPDLIELARDIDSLLLYGILPRVDRTHHT